MSDLRKLQGRPKLAKDRRSKKIDARFTEDEYNLILSMEKELGISKTELVRLRLLKNGSKIVINAREMIKQLDLIGTEMARSGNNINQLARYSNTLKLHGSLSPSVASEFNRLLEGHIKIYQDLEVSLRKILREMGR